MVSQGLTSYADIDCLNYPSSLWSNVVYNLNEGTT